MQAWALQSLQSELMCRLQAVQVFEASPELAEAAAAAAS